jgi:O-antigen/teichoic acid export membrane protein
MVSGKTIAKNVGAMMISQITTWGFAIILAIFVPRYLGAEYVGIISISNSIWLIISMVLSFGMDTYLTKTIARYPEKASELLSTSLLIRTAFFVMSCGIVALYSIAMRYSATQNTVIAINSLFFILLSYINGFSAAFVGLERMEFISIASITNRALLAGLSLILIFFDAGLYAIVIAGIVANFIACVILFVTFNRKQPLHFRISLESARSILGNSSIYLVSGLAIVVYQQIDKPFISALANTTTVGWYGTAMNLFGTSMFLPVVFSSVIFPALSRSYASGDAKLNIIAQRSFDLMFLLSVPVGLGLVVIGKPLVALLYGPEFAPSGSILMMLGVVVIFTYLNTILGQLLISTDRTDKWNMVIILAILATLPIDYVLVPWTHQVFGNGGLGGTLAFLVTEFGMVVSAILLLPKHTLQWSNVRTAYLTLLSGLVMMATSWWFRETMMFLSILIAAVTYIGLVAILRIIPREDILLITNALRGIVGRLRRRKDDSATLGNQET